MLQLSWIVSYITNPLLSYKVRWLEINFTLFRLKLLVLLNSLINKECRECQNYGRFPREQGNLNRFRLAQPCSIRTQLVLIITPVFCTHLWLNNFVYNECAKHLHNDSLLSTRKKKIWFHFLSLFLFSNSFKETRDVIVLYPFQGKHIGRHFVRTPVLRTFFKWSPKI